MTKYIVNVSKWLPLETESAKQMYVECKKLKYSCVNVCCELNYLISEYKRQDKKSLHYDNNNLLVEKFESISKTAEILATSLSSCFQKLKIEGNTAMAGAKIKLWIDILCKLKLKLSFYLKEMVNNIATQFTFSEGNLLELTLKISVVYNSCISMDNKHGLPKSKSISCNTCPYLMYPHRKISVTQLLQIVALSRAESCSHKLIDCLLQTFKSSEAHQDDDSSSDSSSIEIYRAITKHMSPPAGMVKQQPKTNKTEIEENICFASVEELIIWEQQNVLTLLTIILKVAPNMLGNDAIKTSKKGEAKVSMRAQKKVLEYYQQVLWGEVGNFLEHIILWWGSSPMAARSPRSSQHLRDWITQFLPTAEVPQFITSALTNLGDALGVHVTSTLWDQQFRQALVASKQTCNFLTGPLFCEMLRDLVSLCNHFEVTNDWVVGAPLDELPLVEQIPVLHRLDHSIHTTRLWAANETKKIANSWNMKAFFTVTHHDIVNSLTQLNMLRLTDYTVDIEKGGLGVHVQVCALMRAKLVSEVKENIQKLKETPAQCIDCLASICTTISLANLQMIFPQPSYWRKTVYDTPEKPSSYVEKYLNQILLPVLRATDDPAICNMILKLICEAWLDHIYMTKIKFSHHGACQLLCDFAYIGTWLINCNCITQEMRKKMLKNEVLRRCEGVGKLLLRSPGEHIKMAAANKKKGTDHSPSSEKELMPAEMYVPNQEQWLQLRASKKKLFRPPFCCTHMQNY